MLLNFFPASCGSTNNSPNITAPTISNPTTGIQTRVNSGIGVAAYPPTLIQEKVLIPETTLSPTLEFAFETENNPPDSNYWIVWSHEGLPKPFIAESKSGEEVSIPLAQLPVGSNTMTATAYGPQDFNLLSPLGNTVISFRIQPHAHSNT